jgi:hypothetical protein
MNDSALIVLTREPKAWRDGGRSYALMIDGQQVGKIRRGQRLEHYTAPGRHEIYMKISWCQSQVLTVDVSSGDVVKLHCEPGGRADEALADVVTGSKAYIRLTRLD